MRSILAAIILGVMILTGDSAISAEVAYPVFPLEQVPVMDGKWNGSAWENIPAAIGLTSIKNGSFVSMRQTAFKIGRYGDNLYIAVKCEEPEPDKIKVDENNYRDGWYPDDNLEFFFSQDKSPKGFKQFVTNSRGARWANCVSLNTAEPWQSSAYKGADYWSVEMKIPFSQLGIGSDIKTKQFWFNLGRAAGSNPDNEQFSSFSPVKNGFADVKNFVLLTFKNTPNPAELAQARKNLNRLDNWMRERLWKIANVKEPFLVDKQADDKVQQLLLLKQQAKKMLAIKSLDGAAELIKQYDKQVGEINMPTKQVVLQVQNRDANTRLYLDGRELLPDAPGKYIARIKEGVSVLAVECVASGSNPGVQIGIEGMPETASRWKVSAKEEKCWQDSAFSDAQWGNPTLKDGNFLWAAEPATKIYMRQVILWNNTHDGELRCILPLVREWGFSENSTDTLFLALYSPLPYFLTDYEFQLDMPEGFELLDMHKTTSERSWHGGKYKMNCTPEKITKVPVEHQGVKYNRYNIKYKNGDIPRPGAPEPAFYSMLPVKLNKWNSDQKETCFYYARQAHGNFTEIATKLPVRILPPINGRMLKKVMIQQYCGSPYMGTTLSNQHLEEHIKTAKAAGFNYWIVVVPWNDYGKKFNNMLVDANASLVAVMNNYPIWGNCEVNGALLKLIETRPEFKAKYFNNTSIKDKHYQRYCPSYVTIGEGRNEFKEAVKKDLKEKAFELIPQAQVYWNNWESQSWQLAGSYTTAQKGDESYCFCDRCKKAFKEYAKIPAGKELSDDEIFKNYYKQWAAFRAKLDGEVEGIVNEACNELGKKYYLYHGTTDNVLWEACRGKIEHAFPGLPGNGVADSRQQQYLDDSMEFFRTKVGIERVVGQRFSFMGPYNSAMSPAGKGCQVLSADGYVNARSWKSQIVRIVASTHEGVDMQSSLEAVAGMFYYVGEATRLIADYEDLFYSGKREDSLAVSEQLKYPNLLVLTKGDERLILLFNETDKPLKVDLNNNNLKTGQSASVFESSEKISNPEKMSVTVAAGDVAAVHIK
jgi:hypothetical protein